MADGLRTQRLDRPYVREKRPAASRRPGTRRLALVAAKLKAAKPERIGAIAGDLAGAEEMFALKDLLVRPRRRATSTAGRTAPSSTRGSAARAICSTPTIEGIEQADAILLVGTNPRLEAAVLNARIRKRWRQGGARRRR